MSVSLSVSGITLEWECKLKKRAFLYLSVSVITLEWEYKLKKEHFGFCQYIEYPLNGSITLKKEHFRFCQYLEYPLTLVMAGVLTDPPLLYFYAPRVNETKIILFAL